ncbi:uncharacterized protein LOC109524511 [Hippocampus comes]|uniref:uncharacterized protein LOC109524511 n=1 Tax=Hippocampus comes TaxID=109280 RepID=UPI00094E5B1F|nr:PREDICTED: uncharacterized protein LOC109524511 [Hippocampus comes]
MSVFSNLVRFLVSNKANKKKADRSKEPHEMSNEDGVPKSVSESGSIQTQDENNPLLVADKDRQKSQATSEQVQSGKVGGRSDTADGRRERTGEARALRTASGVPPAQKTEDNSWLQEYLEKTPARTAREKEWCEWFARREKESNARFQRALQGVQDTMMMFGSQLEGTKRDMDATVADLRAQMLSLQRSMAAGIVQRDERIAKLESQNCLLPGSRMHNAAPLDLEPPHHLPYDCHFAPVTPPFFILRNSSTQYPMPDGGFPAYLQPPLDLDRRSPPFV